MALVLEPDPETFASISLTQKTLKASPAFRFLKTCSLELNSVIQHPRILLFKHGLQLLSDDLNCLLGLTSSKPIKYFRKESSVETCNQLTCPFAVVVLLSASGGHGYCHLSGFDSDVLHEVKGNFKDFNDITFIIKYSRNSINYTSVDLDRLSKEIQFKLYGSKHPNNIFVNTFLFNDNHISFRIGLRMHKSIQKQLLNIQISAQNLLNEINSQYVFLEKARNKVTKSVSEIIRKQDFKCCPNASRKRSQTVFENIATALSKYVVLEQGKLLRTFLTKVQVRNITEKRLTSIIDTFLKHKENGIHKKHTKTKEQFEQFLLSNAIVSYSCSTKNEIRLSNLEAVKASELICSDLYSIIGSKVDDQGEKIKIFCSILEDECTNSRLHGVSIHELKVLAYRHEKISGFGFIDGAVSVYIKGSMEEDKKEVLTFFENYIDTTEYDFKIEFRKKREITYFSKLENGSRINKLQTAGKGPKHYGTLGMFLKDSSETYFFTTCAHVIEKDAIAYFPDDNTEIGKNVFICHPNTNNDIKHAQNMDFSLIRVCPEFDIECKLGLKSVNGNLIKGDIFKGDILEMLGRKLYKWGATEPFLQTGKCTGIEEDGFILIQINTKNFAKPGDSGALICAVRDNDTALAAFVLVGEEMTKRSDDKTTYAVYKVADALDMVAQMTKAMEPCLCTTTLTVVSASSSAAAKRAIAKSSKQ